MTRVQILLSDDEDRRLEKLARESGESKSSLVRRAVGLLFRVEAEKGEALLGLIGQAGRSGVRKVAQDHDRLLADAQLRSASR